MLLENEELLYKIVNGSPEAYQNFLISKEKRQINCSYEELFNYVFERDDLSKCDYYALYDICQYFIESFSIKSEEKKQIALKIFPKLYNAAKKEHIAAKCVLVMLNTVLKLDKLSEEDMDNFRRSALNIVLKTKSKNKSLEKLAWSNIFLGIHAHLVLSKKSADLKNDESVLKYLNAAHIAGNAVATHFLSCYGYTKAEQKFPLLNNCKKKPPNLTSFNIEYALTYVCLLNLNQHVRTLERTRAVRLTLNNFCDYNPAKAYYLQGYLELLTENNKNLARQFFQKSKEHGHPDADKILETIDKTISEHKKKSTANKLEKEIVNDKQLDNDHESQTNNVFLVKHKEQLTVSLHNALHVVKNSNNASIFENVIDQSLYSKILSEIETNHDITRISINYIFYEFDVEMLLKSMAKNKNIHSFEISNIRLNIKDYIKIVYFISSQTHIRHVAFKNNHFNFDRDKKDQQDQLIINTMSNFVANAKHLDSFHLAGLLYDNEYIKSFLLAIKKNVDLKKTHVILEDLVFDNDNLLLLSDVLNHNICHFKLLTTEEHAFDEKGIRQFAERLKGNNNLKSLSIRSFLANDTDDIILKASHFLFNTLMTSSNIESLDLSDTIYHFNELGIVMKELCSSLKTNNWIKELKLSNNSLNDIDIKLLAYVFKHHSKIQRLNISGNDFTHVGVEVLADILGRYKNDLHYLNIDSPPAKNDDDCTNFDGNKMLLSLADLIKSPFCVLENLSIPMKKMKNTEKDYSGFKEFLSAVKLSKTIRKLSFSNYLDEKETEMLINLVSENKNIVSINYFINNLESTITKLEDLLEQNKKLSSEKPSHKLTDNITANPLPAQKEVKPSVIISPKVTENTFQDVLDFANVKYKLTVSEVNNLITIAFADMELAKIATNILNGSKQIATFQDNTVSVPNYSSIDEREILSIKLILAFNFRKSIQTSIEKTLLLDTLQDIKQIHVSESNDDIYLCLNKSLKLDKQAIENIFSQITKILEQRNIAFNASSTQLFLLQYKSIDKTKIIGLASQIKQIIKDQCTAYKSTIGKDSYWQINAKIQTKKLKKELDKNSDKQKKPIDLNQVINSTAENKETYFETNEESPEKIDINNNNISIQCITYNNGLSETPTEERFRKFVENFRNSTTVIDNSKKHKLMLLIINHHYCLLTFKSFANKNKLAYFMLYHAIRISELTHYYMQSYHNDDSSITSSAYASRVILADRTDHFLPEDSDRAIYYLQTHSRSFLTVNRQILLDLFDDSTQLKTKIQLGYANIFYYGDFFKNSFSKNKLAVPATLTTKLENVLFQMKKVVDFVRTALNDLTDTTELFTDNSFNNIALGALKGALFLLGHFARIIRDYHGDFINKSLPNSMAKNNYSQDLKAVLIELFGEDKHGNVQFELLDSIGKLDEKQVLKIANSANFVDHCLFFIQARNTMGHNSDNASDVVSTDVIIDEIPVSAVVHLCVYFVSYKTFSAQLDSLLNCLRNNESELKLNRLDPDAPIFSPRSKDEITEKDFPEITDENKAQNHNTFG